MNRRGFIQKAITSAIIAPLSYQLLASKDCYSTGELTGQKKPQLLGKGVLLREKAALSFERMQKQAAKEGIILHSVSSYRSFDRQKGIWDRKYAKYTSKGISPENTIQKIIEYSTIPGTSRHHWGTDLDIIDLSQPTPNDPLHAKHFHGGVYNNLREWLKHNAAGFGFYEVYTNDIDRKGFKYEPWHYSYADTSLAMLEEYLKIDLKAFILNSGINGSNHFSTEFVTKYINENVLGINKILKL